MAKELRIGPAMAFSIRAAQIEAQRDALLAAATAVLADCPTCAAGAPVLTEQHYQRQPTHQALRAAIAKTEEAKQ